MCVSCSLRISVITSTVRKEWNYSHCIKNHTFKVKFIARYRQNIKLCFLKYVLCVVMAVVEVVGCVCVCEYIGSENLAFNTRFK